MSDGTETADVAASRARLGGRRPRGGRGKCGRGRRGTRGGRLGAAGREFGANGAEQLRAPRAAHTAAARRGRRAAGHINVAAGTGFHSIVLLPFCCTFFWT